jgi:hypothetical protein
VGHAAVWSGCTAGASAGSSTGFHFLQEEAPDAFSEALARFVAKVRAGAKG